MKTLLKALSDSAGVAMILMLLIIVIVGHFLVDPQGQTRLCDAQCNLSACGCVRTCPNHRGE